LNLLRLEATPPDSKAAAVLTRRGGAPADYLWDGTHVIRHNAETRAFLDALIAEQREIETEKDAKRAAEQAVTDAEAAARPTFLTIIYAPAYGTDLHKARRLTEREKQGIADWAKEWLLVSLGESIKLSHPNTPTARLALSRWEDGQFMGCENRAVTITSAEWDAIVAEQASADEAEERARQEAEDQAAAKRADALAEARATGKAVALRQWTTGRCMNHHDDECSFDDAVEWLRPDGTTKVTYSCCY
jgi:Asp/Glu/hydantoin racemase